MSFISKHPWAIERCTLCVAFFGLFTLSALAQTGQRPTIIGVTVPAISQSNALLRARFNPNTTGAVQAWFNWGKTTNIANRTPSQSFSGGTNSIVFSNLLTKLATNQTYYFRCNVSNKFGITRSAILTFKTKHDVQFLDLAATNIEPYSVSLTATFTAEHSGLTWFRWGGSTNVGNSTAPINYTAGTNTISVTQLLSNLTPNKKYYYRLMASNQFGVSSSAISNFSTRLNFRIASVDVSFESYMVPTHGNVYGTMDPPGDYFNWSFVWFEWGADTNNPWASQPRQGDWILGTWMGNSLQPGAVYYCRMIATNIYGRDSTPWKEFRAPTGLSVTTYPAGSGNTVPSGPGYPQGIGAISSTRARLGAGVANYFASPTDAWFEWGTTTNYESRTAIAGSGLNGFEAFAELTGLQEAGAIYHYRAVASNSIGIEFGADQTFSTPLFPLASASSNLPGVVDGSAMWGDFNNDGLLDVVVAGESGNGAICQLWLNRGSAFAQMETDLPGIIQVAFSGGDHDNDGRLDFLTGSYASGEFRVWRNTGGSVTIFL